MDMQHWRNLQHYLFFFPNVLEIIILPYIVESARTVVRFRAVLKSVAVYYVGQRWSMNGLIDVITYS